MLNEQTRETSNFVDKSVKIHTGLAQCLDNFDRAPPRSSPADRLQEKTQLLCK